MDFVFNVENFNTFEAVLSEIMKSLHKSEEISLPEIDHHIIATAKNDLRKLLSVCNFDANEVEIHLKNKDWDSMKIKYFLTLFKQHRSSLIFSALIHHNSKYGDTVVDYNWALKLVLGTSDTKILKYPIFQITFTSHDDSGNLQGKLYDMNKEMVYKIIDSLESSLKK